MLVAATSHSKQWNTRLSPIICMNQVRYRHSWSWLLAEDLAPMARLTTKYPVTSGERLTAVALQPRSCDSNWHILKQLVSAPESNGSTHQILLFFSKTNVKIDLEFFFSLLLLCTMSTKRSALLSLLMWRDGVIQIFVPLICAALVVQQPWDCSKSQFTRATF